MIKALKTLSILAVVASLAPMSIAQNTQQDVDIVPYTFVKKRYHIKGQAEISKVDGQRVLALSDDFKTKSGPDLKVYLSKRSLSTLDGKSVESSSIKLSVLKSNRGAQSYIIPDDIELSEFQSVVIHCEAFSVLWGGFDL